MNSFSSYKILVAEDDKFLARAYQFKLSKMGCAIILTSDGEETIAKIKSEKPDLVLLDIIMPKKTGFDVLTEMKSAAEVKDIPVIIMSNLGQEADVKKGLQAGAADYIIKASTSLEEVVGRIEKILGGRSGAGVAAAPKAASKKEKVTLSPVASAVPLVCPGCHGALPSGAKFCPFCGQKI
ncbi:response regulator [Candidatus Peregrinibacteria bacterium]|nr:response regulator [Candidatus Peregrinibacteria bacterium]